MLYLVRTTKEFAFSEAAAFRDFLVVAQKPQISNSGRSAPCKVVYLNRSIEDISVAEAGDIADSARQIHPRREQVETDDFTLFTVPQAAIRDRSDNLWFMVGFENPRNAAVVSRVWARLFELAGSRLTRLRDAVGVTTNRSIGQLVPRGFEPKPSGLYTSIFAVRQLAPKRVGLRDLVINDETRTLVRCGFRNQEIKLPKSNVELGIKTAAYFRRFVISPHYGDWVLTKPCEASKSLQRLSKVRVNYAYVRNGIQSRKAHLLVRKRFNIVAEGTSFMAFYAEDGAVSPNTFYSVRCPKDQSLALALWLNSIFGIIQVLSMRMETEGGFCDLLKEDLVEFIVPSEIRIPRRLATWYQRHRTKDFPPLADQFLLRSPRRGLDREIMRWMSWPAAEIDADLDSLYGALAEELSLLREAMRRGGRGRNRGHGTPGQLSMGEREDMEE
jgi:hypothetical protein